MSADEFDTVWSAADPVVIRLRRYTAPPGLDTATALAAGRRSVRRRRWATVATVTAAVVAAAGVAAVAMAPSPDAPDVRPAEVSPSASPASTPAPDGPPTVGPTRTLSPTGTLSCDATPWELPAGGGWAEINGVAPDGRLAVGSIDAPTGRQILVWRDGRLEPADQAARWLVVNRSGVMAGIKVAADDPHTVRAYVKRDGQVRELPTPAGYRAAVPMAVTDGGDVFGTLRRGEMVPGDGPAPGFYNFHNGGTARDLDIVVWPAASPDSPAVIPEPGEATVIGVAGPDRMLAGVKVGTAMPRPYSWSVTRAGGPLTLPAAWTGLDLRAAAGDHLYGALDERTLVRWTLSTGRIDVFTGAPDIAAANGTGWFATNGHTESVLVAPDGTARTLPAGRPVWIDADGRTVFGTDQTEKPVTWRCR
jgi:hypothetical protein